jgi:hypothetical protein
VEAQVGGAIAQAMERSDIGTWHRASLPAWSQTARASADRSYQGGYGVRTPGNVDLGPVPPAAVAVPIGVAGSWAGLVDSHNSPVLSTTLGTHQGVHKTGATSMITPRPLCCPPNTKAPGPAQRANRGRRLKIKLGMPNVCSPARSA